MPESLNSLLAKYLKIVTLLFLGISNTMKLPDEMTINFYVGLFIGDSIK
jgi:hypothetical protein